MNLINNLTKSLLNFIPLKTEISHNYEDRK